MNKRKTRKLQQHVEDSCPTVQKKNKLPLCFDRFLKEGEELYNYMIINFHEMYTNDIIKHFDIRYGLYSLMGEADEFRAKYGLFIQKDLIQWIKQEYFNERLFNKELWRPFRDRYHMTSMYYGYKKMFNYLADDGLNYYLQLAIEEGCENICATCDDCCDHIHFGLMLFGYIDSGKKLSPYDILEMTDENMIVGRFWDKY